MKKKQTSLLWLPYFVALGSAVYASGETKTYTYEEALHKMEQMANIKVKTDGLSPLFKDEKEYEEFIKRHGNAKVARSDIHTYQGNAYLGIDSEVQRQSLRLLMNTITSYMKVMPAIREIH